MRVFVTNTDIGGMYLYRVFVKGYPKPIQSMYSTKWLTQQDLDDMAKLYEEALSIYRPLMLPEFLDES